MFCLVSSHLISRFASTVFHHSLLFESSCHSTPTPPHQMLFNAVGKEPNFFFAPLWLFDVIIDSLQWVSDTFESEKFENAAELGRIGKYYAVEDMLTTEPDEKFGTITLQEHYDRIAVEGQEYDPYTTMFAKAPE